MLGDVTPWWLPTCASRVAPHYRPRIADAHPRPSTREPLAGDPARPPRPASRRSSVLIRSCSVSAVSSPRAPDDGLRHDRAGVDARRRPRRACSRSVVRLSCVLLRNKAWPHRSPFPQAAKRPVEAGEARRRTRPAKLQVQRANRVEPGEPLVALPADQRVLGDRKQGDGRKLLGRCCRNTQQKRSWRSLRQCASRAVVGLDLPTPRARRKPARRAADRA